MNALDMIRNMAVSGKLTAFDCMRIVNSISFALEDMLETEQQLKARQALIHTAYALMLMDKGQA